MQILDQRCVVPGLVISVGLSLGLVAGQVNKPARRPSNASPAENNQRLVQTGNQQAASRTNGLAFLSTDTTPPHIDQISPPPSQWIVNEDGLQQIQIGFDEPVTIFAEALTIWTVGGGPVTAYQSSYESMTNTLTITFDLPITDDRLTIVLHHSVKDLASNELDGEILDPISPALPSGDGQRGGHAVFRYNILQGDVNRDGAVDITDGAIIQVTLGRCQGDPAYTSGADLNGDGCINVYDSGIFIQAEGNSLPALDGQAPSVMQVTPDPVSGLADVLTDLTVDFSEALDPLLFDERTGFLIDGSGAIRQPASAELVAPGNTQAIYTYPSLPQCDSYSIHFSNALADVSGMLLTSPQPPPVISGESAPPAPTVDDMGVTVTNQDPITFMVNAPGGNSLEVTGGEFTLRNLPVRSGSFEVEVDLKQNTLNHLFFTTIRNCDGVRSAPTALTIAHDLQLPSLFIDFPTNGAELTNSSTDVAGRVGDVLSGFEGLIVHVNGQAAEVDVGIGTNGTFFKQNVGLNLGRNVIIAQAWDGAGNTRQAQVTVTRTEIPPGVPMMQIFSGNHQPGGIVDAVLENPIVVEVKRGDGTPFANKVVTFRVVRSNGRLTANGMGEGALMFQASTNKLGRAQAFWKLGSDAGCGNNRVEVTSQSIAGTVFFCASAGPGSTDQINIGLGNNQRAEVGSVAADPLRAWVSDGCNPPAEYVPVVFKVVRGGGLVRAVGEIDWLSEVTVLTGETGHAEVEFKLGPKPGINVVEADFDGNATLPARFVALGLERTPGQPTTFSGVVLNNAAQPIEGATCTLMLGPTYLTPQVTGSDGRFAFSNIPHGGAAQLYVDGSTALGGVDHPFLHYKDLMIVPEAQNIMPTPALLPPLKAGNNVEFDNTLDTWLTVQGVDGLKMLVRAGSMTRADGSVPSVSDPAILSLNQVHHDDVPMPLPDGAAPPFAWTLQPALATFDPPIEITYPNMSGLPAGAVAYFLSFNHDTFRFEIVTSGHVTEDGSSIVSDPEGGITTSGWGCNCPPYSVTGDCCDEGCCGDPCCEEGCCDDPCCDPDDPCCGDPDPCCDPDNPCCGVSDDPCCMNDDPCCNDPDECCDDPDPCCDPEDPCCDDPDGPCCMLNCNDGDNCTTDTCEEGVCRNSPIDCNDGDDCTDDSCTTGGGCVHMPTACDPCCFADEQCVGGECVPRCDTCEMPFDGECVEKDCSLNGNKCFESTCEFDTGDCINVPKDCDDFNSQTTDSCNPAIGCIHTPKDCEEGDEDCEKEKEDPPAKPGSDPCPESDDEANPIHYFSGEFYETDEDLKVPGRGFDFVWTRTYRSKIGLTSPLGVGWDFAYNLSIQHKGEDLILCDGKNRIDRYRLTASAGGGGGGGGAPTATWTRPEYFREFGMNEEGACTLTFENKALWEFLPIDGTLAAGKIKFIRDRNGNEMEFEYDELGRLERITDTLDRIIEIQYVSLTSSSGVERDFIRSVEDFAGRKVQYEYYLDGEMGGSFGDLKSVTTPKVVYSADFPIPTGLGHEYPEGKTTAYTYTTGFAHERLNHDLLTITDPKGQTYLQNVYAHTLPPTDSRYTIAPNNLYFDRIVTQTWGDQGDIIDLTYYKVAPSFAYNNASQMTIVNDRNGNVSEYFYDNRNRGVMVREYTGRANPDLPTTKLSNRPTNKLRATDPDFFETRYEYNDDSRVTKITHPNGNITENVYESDFNPDAPARIRGNLREVRHLPGTHQPTGDQTVIVEKFEYESGFGCGGCGSNFVTKYTDGRNHDTNHEYDDNGNRIHTQHRISEIVEDWAYNTFGQLTKHILPDNGSGCRRIDVYTYYTSGQQKGYRKEEIVDAAVSGQSCTGPHFGLTTTLEYDLVGNNTRTIDPRGHDTEVIYNQLNQVVRRISRELSNGSGVRYEQDTFYDTNNNVVRIDIENVDDQGVSQSNTQFTTIFEHEILNHMIRMCQEAGSHDVPTGQFTCAGLPQSEFVSTEFAYDANRNRILTRSGEAVEGRQPTNVVGILYDERDFVFQRIRAQGDSDKSSSQIDYDANGNVVAVREGIENAPRVTTNVYDAYDRMVTMTDPMGNIASYHYDPNDNQTFERIDGQLQDIAGSTGNIRLQEVSIGFDDMDRIVTQTLEFFDPVTQQPLQGGQQLGKAITAYEYTANSQPKRVVDDNNHQMLTTYDTANRVKTIADHKNNTTTYGYDANSNVLIITEVDKSDLGNPDQTFLTTNVYDNLDRLTKTTDNINNINEYGYDSRSNRTLHLDAKRTAPSSPGNKIRHAFDGLNRLVTTTRFLTDDGTGSGTQVDQITTTQVWDDASRVVQQIDDNGNTSVSVYDPLNRIEAEEYEDGTSRSFLFDVHDNPSQTTDANGSVITANFDLLNRVTGRNIKRAANVLGTTFEVHKYDGLSRIVHAQDDDSVVIHQYDSLSNVVRETLNGQSTDSVYNGVGNKLSCTYPGGRQISNEYDELNRKKFVKEGVSTIGAYSYMGRMRVERIDLLNNTRSTRSYDGIRRVIGTSHVFNPSSPTVIDERTYEWNPMHNKTKRIDQRIGGPRLTHDYQYDSIYRLVHTTVNDLSTLLRETDYGLDGVGNRSTVAGQPNPGSYVMDSTVPEPADYQLNQYTMTPSDSRQYDKNGNLGDRASMAQIKYDYRNQMVEYIDLTLNPTQRHVYSYDAVGRRIAKVVDADGQATVALYFYSGWQELEERDGGGVTVATYVHGNGIDELLAMRRGGSDYYYHSDDLYNVMALTTSQGTVVERYEYGDYGQPVDPSSILTPTSGSAIGNPHLFTGRRFDAEVRWFYYRTRYLDPIAGRFTTRDTIGIWGDPLNMGNGYTYVGNSPWTFVDPYGYDAWEFAQGFVAGVGGGGWEFVTGTIGGALDLASGAAELAWDFAWSPMATYDRVFDEVKSLIKSLRQIELGEAARALFPQLARLRDCWDQLSDEEIGRLIGELVGEYGVGFLSGVGAAKFLTNLRKLQFLESSLGKHLDDITRNRLIDDLLEDITPNNVCFAAGTLVLTEEGYCAIEDLRVGDRVLTSDDVGACGVTAVDESWRLITLQMPNPDGSRDVLDIQLLRSHEWIERTGAEEGCGIWVVLEEMGLEGPARVDSIEESPPVDEGCGRVVLATVTHFNGFVLEVTFENSDEVLEPTDRHRFFSLDRNDWIPAGELLDGETIQGRDGAAIITLIRPQPGVHRVYNIEVETGHCFYATRLNVLSHNVDPCSIPGRPFRGKNAADDAFEHLERYHGLDPSVASNRLHKLKESAGLGPADDVAIGRTGDVYNAATGEHIGTLTDYTLGTER